MPPSRLAESVSVRGAQVTTASFTRHHTVTDPRLGERLDGLAAGRYDWLVLTSARTLTALRDLGHDLSAVLLQSTRVAAVGPATAAAAREAGLRVDLLPTSGSGGADLAASFPSPSPDQPGRVLVPGAADPAAGLDAGLTARGFDVDRVAVYRTDPVDGVDEEVRLGWPDGFDAFVVTAPSVVRAAADLLGRPGPPVVALGESSAAAARGAGFTVVATAAEATPAGLVNALVTLRKEAR
ncbi:MAG: uroporphyrinogen-III synthase [Micropruina sp.]